MRRSFCKQCHVLVDGPESLLPIARHRIFIRRSRIHANAFDIATNPMHPRSAKVSVEGFACVSTLITEITTVAQTTSFVGREYSAPHTVSGLQEEDSRFGRFFHDAESTLKPGCA